ncbi:PLDc N-terminal domain-containing protein [Microbacterium sp. ZW T5_56]|uniref:PLDc N-terminal domain-containing protein n=1 Tax=Microbacterium sp. ZW T5_56 TaxID=3378081 RepID=UPI0038525540
MTLLTVALFVTSLVDIILRDSSKVKHLPKVFWILIVILLPLIGSLLWWILGREYDGTRLPAARTRRPAAGPGYLPPRTADTRTTEQQMADLDREIEEWRLREELERRRRANEGGSTPPEA